MRGAVLASAIGRVLGLTSGRGGLGFARAGAHGCRIGADREGPSCGLLDDSLLIECDAQSTLASYALRGGSEDEGRAWGAARASG